MAEPDHAVRLGDSGLFVSRLTLGTMTFGDRTDEAEAARIMADALDRGLFHFDTADTYAGGRSEEIVGRFLKSAGGKGADVVLATKLGNPAAPGPNGRGLSRRWILQEAEASLRRLGRDHIDLLYLHKEDAGTPAEETLRGLEDLMRAGKIRYWGVSNHKSWRLARLCERARAEGIAPPVVSQPLYHILHRVAEVEQFPACAAYGMGAITYSPTARGVLTGKYRDGAAPPEGSRGALQQKRMMQTEYTAENIAAAARVAAHAEARGVGPVAFATAWVLANPAVTSVIAGPRTFAQWRDYLAALDLGIDAEDLDFVDRLNAPGATATTQFIDPLYPVEGRPGRPA